MAFNFLGTINSIEDFEELEEFITLEMLTVSKKIIHLKKESQNYSKLLQKLRQADQILRSGYTKSKPADYDYLVKAKPVQIPEGVVLDGLNAIDVDKLKVGFLDNIKFKRENIEYKVKKTLDLLEQLDNEISLLETRKSDYTDILDNIRSRFDNNDFPEVQRIAKQSPTDVDTSLVLTPKNAGKEISNGITYYLVLKIDSNQKTITFDRIAPPVKEGDTLTLSNGNNNGIKTVAGIKDNMTIYVSESLISEAPSNTKITL